MMKTVFKRFFAAILLAALFASPVHAEGNDANTVLLIHADGSDASTAFTDSSASAHSITAVGNAQIDTAQSKFGGSSMLSDGSSDYLTVPDNDNWHFGSGKYTIDFWVRFNSVGTASFFSQGMGDSNTYANLRYQSSSIQFSADNTVFTYVSPLSGSWSPSTNTWYHVALIRGWGGNANDYAITIDGTAVATGTDTSDYPNYTTSIGIALLYDGAEYGQCLNGWIEEYRITKGVARWTTTFTPPSNPYSSGRKRSTILF